MFARKVHNLRDLGFRDLVRIDAAFADPVMMHMQHDSRRGFAVLVEEALEHVNHELHRGVVVVEDEDTIEARLLGLRLGARDNRAARRSVPAAAPVIVRSARNSASRFSGRSSRRIWSSSPSLPP